MPSKVTKVILLAHGLDGSVKDFQVIQDALRERVDLSTTLILNPDCNRGKTYDGVANGATRLYDHLISATRFIPPGPLQISVMVRKK
jgi:hypothetical protein